MIFRVIFFFILPIFFGSLFLIWYSKKNPKQAIAVARKVGNWMFLILVAIVVTVVAFSFLFTVEHAI